MERLFIKLLKRLLELKLRLFERLGRRLLPFISTQMAPFMVAGIKVHEANTFITISTSCPEIGEKFFQVSLADLRLAHSMVWGDEQGRLVIKVEIETRACTDPNGVMPNVALDPWPIT